jgi:hypothetical protein
MVTAKNPEMKRPFSIGMVADAVEREIEKQ